MSFIPPKQIYDISSAFKPVSDSTNEEKAELVLADGSKKVITLSKENFWNKIFWWFGLSVCVKTKEGEGSKNLYIRKDTVKTLIDECKLPVDETIQKSITRQFAKLIKMTLNEELPQQQTPNKIINKLDAINLANNLGKVKTEKLKPIPVGAEAVAGANSEVGFLFLDIDKFVNEFKGKTIGEAKKKLTSEYGIQEKEVIDIFQKALPEKSVVEKFKDAKGNFLQGHMILNTLKSLNEAEIATLAQVIKDNPRTKALTEDLLKTLQMYITQIDKLTPIQFSQLKTNLEKLGVDPTKL